MQDILEKFEQLISSIDQAKGELFPPATDEELNVAEKELDIPLPEDIRTLYKWHNGQEGIHFLFDEFRIYPLFEMLDMQRVNLECCTPDCTEVTDVTGVFKDCIANPKWLPIGDNGGNTMLYLDMDPGKQGTPGQLLEACDGEPEYNSNSIKAFMQEIIRKIESGEIVWNENAGSFWPVDE